MLSSILAWFGCKTPTYSLAELPEKQLHFGWGGGFAGTQTDYLLLENGQVFHKPDFQKNTLELERVDRKTAKKAVKKTYKMLKNVDPFHYPGNMYYYFEVVEDSTTQRFTWGDINHPVDPVFSDRLKALKVLVKELPVLESPVEEAKE